jgi:hypothetical protein
MMRMAAVAVVSVVVFGTIRIVIKGHTPRQHSYDYHQANK